MTLYLCSTLIFNRDFNVANVLKSKKKKMWKALLYDDVTQKVCVCRPTGQRRSQWKRNLHCRRSARMPWWPSQLRASSRPLTSLYSLHPFHFLSRDVRTLSTGSETAWRNLRDTQSATNVSAVLVSVRGSKSRIVHPGLSTGTFNIRAGHRLMFHC